MGYIKYETKKLTMGGKIVLVKDYIIARALNQKQGPKDPVYRF
jgi:hypothetical protein